MAGRWDRTQPGTLHLILSGRVLNFTQVNVVAHVVSISTQTTNNVYWLDDGTGRIEARHWRDTMTEDDDTEKTGGVL